MKNLAQESFNRNSFLMIILFLAAYIGLIAVSGNMKILVLLFIGCLAILIAVKPFYGLLLSIPLVMWFSYTDLLWISAWNYLLAFLIYLAVLILFLQQKFTLSKYSCKILMTFIFFIILTVCINIS